MTSDIDAQLLSSVRAATGCPQGRIVQLVQSLWSGYGAIYRFADNRSSCIVKHVSPPSERDHPRGWSGDRGHERKLRSYAVEAEWYRNLARRCGDRCRVPRSIHVEADEGSWLFVLEDLDAVGYARRLHRLSDTEMRACLSWLAHFHATFLGVDPDGLWEVGTYWHLATRPDELAVMRDARLRKAAAEIDRRLNASRHRTIVHGDAKVANFCFGADGNRVAAVDFQYVGGGVGVKDVAYFLSSCLDEDECRRDAQRWVDEYFSLLRPALAEQQPDVDAGEVETEWRALYPVAWADFVRFLVGWAPEHYKIHGYSRDITDAVLREIAG